MFSKIKGAILATIDTDPGMCLKNKSKIFEWHLN